MKLPNIVVRILAGAVFVALLIGGMIINEITYLVLFCLITGLALNEFYGLIQKSARAGLPKILGIASGIVLVCSFFLHFFLCFSLGFYVYILLFLVIFINELYRKRENPLKSLAYIVLGQIYIALPFSLAAYLIFWEAPGIYSYTLLLAVFVFIWVNDSFAYLTGLTFGKHRLFERISPKKSWEGFIGGAVFATASSYLFYHFAGILPLPVWIGFALVVVAFGTWGDLVESLMKRTLGVKDSGNTIPGHGGLLDRFDSTILAIPAIVVYLKAFAYISRIFL